MTDVERFLFRGQNLAHWVMGFNFDGKQVRVALAPMTEGDTPVLRFQAVFTEAAILSIEEDDAGRETWPLDVIGFDSYVVGERWKFVLNCGCIEWVWESEWPTPEGTT